MINYKKKYLKYKLKYLSKKGGSISTKLKEIEIKLFGKEQEGSPKTRTDNIEQFLKINLDKDTQSRIRNINSTIHFLPNNYVSSHVPNKGIALFIIGNESGHESSAFGTCYMLKSRLNIHRCDFLYTENKSYLIYFFSLTPKILPIFEINAPFGIALPFS